MHFGAASPTSAPLSSAILALEMSNDGQTYGSVDAFGMQLSLSSMSPKVEKP